MPRKECAERTEDTEIGAREFFGVALPLSGAIALIVIGCQVYQLANVVGQPMSEAIAITLVALLLLFFAGLLLTASLIGLIGLAKRLK